MDLKLAPLAGAVLALLTLSAVPARAQDGPPTGNAQTQTPAKLDRVEVTAKPQSDADMRRRSRVAKQLYGREELDKYGDTNVADVLKRLPGVTMRGSTPVMRGLGSGYTLILLNGDPAPPGFDLSQLDPAQVERIEVSKAPTADLSAQAVAGTINIILREPPKRTQRELRVGVGYSAVRPSASGTYTYGSSAGGLSYLLPLSVFGWRNQNVSDITRYSPGTDYRPSLVTEHQVTDNYGTGFNATPRLNWKIDDAQTLTLLGFLQKGQWHSNSRYAYSDIEGAPSLDANANNLGTWQMVRGNVQYQNQFSDTQRVELKAGVQDARGGFDNVTASEPPRTSSGTNRDRNLTQSGKFAQLVGDAHSVSVGWELEWRRHDEERAVEIAGVPQLPGIDGLPFSARIARQALWAQDEWDISKQWSAYLGLRSERIVTESAASDTGETRNVSSVTTPLLHLNYKLDPKGRDLIRASLTRSYKVPDLSALLARPALSSLYPDPTQPNTEISPDHMGNPTLKPELATGLDLAYETYLPSGGVMSIGLFRRDVDNLIRTVTSLETVSWSPVQRWIAAPTNFSKATATGLELELKGQAGELMPRWFDPRLPLNLRASLNVYRSDVETLPGPNNRLDGQQPWSGTFGFDYRMRSEPFAFGSSLTFTPGYTTTQTADTSVIQSRRRGFDAYLLWTLSKTSSLRVSANNLQPVDTNTTTLLGSGYYSGVESYGRTQFGISMEMKL